MADIKLAQPLRRRKDLTAEQVRSLLNYDPETGILTWRVNRRGSALAGTVAGHLNHAGYLYFSIYNRAYFAHRIAWLWYHGEWPTLDLDHIDGDKTNNRLANLREATRSQNAFNRRRNRDNKSGYKGVRFNHRYGQWDSCISIDGKQCHLGFFKTAEEAFAAYCEASAKFHGEFARTA